MLRNSYDVDHWPFYRPGGVVRSGALSKWAMRVYLRHRRTGDQRGAECARRILHAAQARLNLPTRRV